VVNDAEHSGQSLEDEVAPIVDASCGAFSLVASVRADNDDNALSRNGKGGCVRVWLCVCRMNAAGCAKVWRASVHAGARRAVLVTVCIVMLPEHSVRYTVSHLPESLV
jgi:hypothetical protein